MFDQLKDMGKLAKKAKEMKDQMKKIQGELKDTFVDAEEGGVKVVMNGEMDVQSVEITELALLQNKVQLEKMIQKAVNKASRRAKESASSKLAVVSKGLNIPGL